MSVRVAVVVVAVLAACKGKAAEPTPEPTPTPVSTTMSVHAAAVPVDCMKLAEPGAMLLCKTLEMRDRMCACPDAACATKTNADYNEWSMRRVEEWKGAPPNKPDHDSLMQAGKAVSEYADCMGKLTQRVVNVGASLNAAIAKVVELKDQMCVCQDKACAKTLNDQFITWTDDLEAMKDVVPTPEQSKALTDATTKYAACMKTASGLTTTPVGSDDVAKYVELEHQMCACTDAACADKVMKDFAVWGRELEQRIVATGAKPTGDVFSAMKAASDAFDACAKKAKGEPPPGEPTKVYATSDSVEAKVAIAQLDSFETKVCDCKNKQCADKVVDAYQSWRIDSARQDLHYTKASEAHMRETLLGFYDCIYKASDFP